MMFLTDPFFYWMLALQAGWFLFGYYSGSKRGARNETQN